jgi:hypothetical protein
MRDLMTAEVDCGSVARLHRSRQESQSMPPPHIFVSTRSRREYSRRRAPAQIVPLAIVLALWVLAALALWWGLA